MVVGQRNRCVGHVDQGGPAGCPHPTRNGNRDILADEIGIFDIRGRVCDGGQKAGAESIEQFILGPDLDTVSQFILFAGREGVTEVGDVFGRKIAG